jgi:outer membrane lipoprotein-sorting protein
MNDEWVIGKRHGPARRHGLSRRVWLAGVALSLVGMSPRSALAQADEPLALVEATAARYEQVTRFCADFTQHLSVPLLGDERTGTGQMCQSRPNKFAMRFSDPEGDLVVVDGEWVWLYYPSLDPNQVIRFAMADGAGAYDFHKEFLDEPATKYDVTYESLEEVAGRQTHRLRLLPLARASYESAVIWIDEQEPVLRQVRIVDENGTVRTITLERVDLDPIAVGDDWFTFTPPPGAQVISR